MSRRNRTEDEARYLASTPERTREIRNNARYGFRTAIKVANGAKMSAVMSAIVGNDNLKGDVEMMAGTYEIRATLDVRRITDGSLGSD